MKLTNRDKDRMRAEFEAEFAANPFLAQCHRWEVLREIFLQETTNAKSSLRAEWLMDRYAEMVMDHECRDATEIDEKLKIAELMAAEHDLPQGKRTDGLIEEMIASARRDLRRLLA